MPASRVIAFPSLGRKSCNDAQPTHQASRIPAPATRVDSYAYDPDLTPSRPPKAKFTRNTLPLSSLYHISKSNKGSTRNTRPVKSLLNNKFAASQLSLSTKLDALSQVTTHPHTVHAIVNSYPSLNDAGRSRDIRFKMPTMPALPFKVSKSAAHARQQSKSSCIPIPQKQPPRQLLHPGDEIDDELGASFASNMSLNSPPHTFSSLPPEEDSREYAPMDIASAPQRVLASGPSQDLFKMRTKPLGINRTASQRSFGRDVSNIEKIKGSGGKTSGSKKLARSALPFEWLNTVKKKEPTPPEHSAEMFAPTNGRRGNLFEQTMDFPSSDAMDVDEDADGSESATVGVPSPACSTSDDQGVATPFPTSPASTSAVIEVDSEPELEVRAPLRGLFKDISPLRPGARRSYHEDSSMSFLRDTPLQPVHKKRRSLSPERSLSVLQLALPDQDSLDSSPGLMSSPSVSKLERLQGRPLKALPIHHMEPGPNLNAKRPRRLALSALVPARDTIIPEEIRSARPVMQAMNQKEEVNEPRRFVLPPVRRSFSAAYTKGLNLGDKADETGSSVDSEFYDVSSPALARMKRQQVKTLRRCDGTDDFRSITGATAMLKRDDEMRPIRKSEESNRSERDTPRSKYLSATGSRAFGGFGDSEASGKILPCHRVKSDGLMRITWETMNKLLDGTYNSRIDKYYVVDCRFDYEYHGGHIEGAININSTQAVEQYFLGDDAAKPKPSTSIDGTRKTIIVFHCEFSHERAPTFAKHLRHADRNLNGRVYPNIHFPDIYVLEGGYCEYFKRCSQRCNPRGYISMDDPEFVKARNEELDQFRKGKFGRTKSYAYGEGKNGLMAALQQPKRSSAPNSIPSLFAAGNMARTRRNPGLLQTLQEDNSGLQTDDEDDADIGDSPCPPPSKTAGLAFMGRKMSRAPLARAETYGPSRMSQGI